MQEKIIFLFSLYSLETFGKLFSTCVELTSIKYLCLCLPGIFSVNIAINMGTTSNFPIQKNVFSS